MAVLIHDALNVQVDNVDDINPQNGPTTTLPWEELLMQTDCSIASTAPHTGIGSFQSIVAEPLAQNREEQLPQAIMERYIELAQEVALECQGFGSEYEVDITLPY